MNVHPIFVHFPIALLTIYAALEVLRFKKWTASPAYTSIKAFLAIIGTVTAVVAFSTGDTATSVIRSHPELRQVLRVHENFASWTVAIFSVIGVAYLIDAIVRSWNPKPSYQRFIATPLGKAWKLLEYLASYILRPSVVIILALSGLFFITVTGTLGGLMVYGKSSDPIISALAALLFPSL